MPMCCSTLQYLEGGAYIAIIIAVIGVPQLLTYFLDRRDRQRDRRERYQERQTRREEERTRREEERARYEQERARQKEERARHEQDRDMARQEAERRRYEERAEADRRHQETLTAMTALIAAVVKSANGNGHSSGETADTIAQLLQRVRDLEAENARLRHDDHANGGGGDADG